MKYGKISFVIDGCLCITASRFHGFNYCKYKNFETVIIFWNINEIDILKGKLNQNYDYTIDKLKRKITTLDRKNKLNSLK